MNEIMRATQYHHNLVQSKGYYVIMTSLVGSQNYGLNTDASDIDTYSFILPSLEELSVADEPKAGLIFAEDGHCNFKDIRIALNLLKKTSPNSVEYFISKYQVYNPIYKDILCKYLNNNTILWNMVHCNYKHMLYAIAGMAHQLTKRNMATGKRFSHALRLENMIYQYFHSQDTKAILDFYSDKDKKRALLAKYDNSIMNGEYDIKCAEIADELSIYSSVFQVNEEQEKTQKVGIDLINSLQKELLQKYLMETIKKNGN